MCSKKHHPDEYDEHHVYVINRSQSAHINDYMNMESRFEMSKITNGESISIKNSQAFEEYNHMYNF